MKLLAGLLVALVGTLPADGTCPKEPSCNAIPPGSKVADPLDCHNYYVCLGDGTASDLPFTCSGGSFNFAMQDCSGPEDCQLSCFMTECTIDLVCDSELDRIFDPNSCNSFYQCLLEGNPILQHCTSHYPYFDRSTGQCSDDPNACCDPCVYPPFCTTMYTEYPDPMNCSNYYMCTQCGVFATSDMLFNCPNGNDFDPQKGHCTVSTGTCTTLCNPAGSTTTTTTTTMTTTTTNTY